jgi:hypothetical protein
MADMAPENSDYTDEPPRRRRDDDEGYSDEPPRRRRPRDPDDEDDDIRARIVRRRGNWLDRQFADTSIVLLVLFPLCCGTLALIFGIVGVAACQEPKARRNALIVLVISVIWIAVAITAVALNQLFGK